MSSILNEHDKSCMDQASYSIDKLQDHSRLDEVYQLTYNTLIERDYILPRSDKKAVLYPELDGSDQTTIIIAESNGKIIGTCSFSVDGANGLHTDHFFKEETDLIRKQTTGLLGSAWRIATDSKFRSNKKLVIDLITKTFEVAMDLNVQTTLFVFQQRHVPVYRRLLGAEVVAVKTTYLMEGKDVDMSLMQVNIPKSWERFKNQQKAS